MLAAWLVLTGPDNQTIEIQTPHIVTTRPPRGNEHFHPSVKCLLHMADGKVVTVIQTCEEVRQMREELEQE